MAGQSLRWNLHACTEKGSAFAVGWADVTDPAAVGTVLSALATTAVANLDGRVQWRRPAQVPGMTHQPGAVELGLQGRRPDGQPVVAEVTVFAHGLRVHQALWMAGEPAPDVAQHFRQSLKVAP